ncbi:hypothetical protein MRX96_007422 [Rhipicephalus microplus]
MSPRGVFLVVLVLVAATYAGPCGDDEDPDRATFWSCFARKLTATEKNVMTDLKNVFFRRSQKQLNLSVALRPAINASKATPANGCLPGAEV